MRMAELSARTGVARETIHFYLREGLLQRPEKSGQTVAYYGEEHLERIRLIRRLREEKYLPIAAIRRLLDSPAAAAERDLEALAEILHIIPASETWARPASAEARAEAEARGLLAGSRGAEEDTRDPAARRVLGVVEEALALEPVARDLTLDDLAACARSLTDLVGKEAALFFDVMFRSGDAGGAIGALRAGRPPVARFIAAYRDLMLRRAVEEVLQAFEHGPEAVARAATIPLSAAKEAELGVLARRAEVRARFEASPSPETARRLVFHLFGSGAWAELSAVPASVIALAGERFAPLSAWGAHEAARSAVTFHAFEASASSRPDLVLGQILLGEALVTRGLRKKGGGASLLDQAIPALHRVLFADPDRDLEPMANVFGWFHRGRLELALPAVLGRAERGKAALLRAVERVEAGAIDDEPAARARVLSNAKLSLARHHAAAGEREQARRLFDEASSLDPEGGVARAASAERGDPPAA